MSCVNNLIDSLLHVDSVGEKVKVLRNMIPVNPEFLGEYLSREPDVECRTKALHLLNSPEEYIALAASVDDPELKLLIMRVKDKSISRRIMKEEENCNYKQLCQDISDEKCLVDTAVKVDSPEVRRALAERIENPDRIVELFIGIDDEELGKELLQKIENNHNSIKKAAEEAKSVNMRQLAMDLLDDTLDGIEPDIDIPNEKTDAGMSDNLKNVIHKYEDICDRIEKLPVTPSQDDIACFEKLCQDWEKLADAPEEYAEILNKRFNKAREEFIRQVESSKQLEEEYQKKLSNLNSLYDEIKVMEQEEYTPDYADRFRKLSESWKKNVAGLNPSEITDLQTKFDAVADKIKMRFSQQELKVEEALKKISDICIEIEEYLKNEDPEGMQSKRAAYELAVKTAIEESGNAEDVKKASHHFDRLLKKHSYQLHQVYQTRDLARWEHYTLKLDLCTQVEALQDTADNELPAAAKKLKLLRKHWKEIGSVPHEKAQEIWDRFRGNCDKLQERISAYYDTLSERREEITVQKVKLCERAEAIQESQEWESTANDFKALQKEWRDIGFTHPEQERELYKRFRAACDVFFNARKEFYRHVKVQREDSLNLKRELCEEAKQLFTLSYGEAHKLIPGLWERWKKAGSAGKEDRLLYEEFRGTFDKYYSDLREQRSGNLEAKKELIKEFEELAGQIKEDDQNVEVQKEFLKLQQKWHDIGPMPRAEEKPVLDKYRELCARFSKLAGKVRREKEKTLLENCLKLEQILCRGFDAVKAEDSETLAACREEWDEANFHEKSYFEKTFNELCALQNDHDAAHKFINDCAENLKLRKMICLEMEKLAGVDGEENRVQDLAEELSMAIASNFGNSRQKKERLSPEKAKEFTVRWLRAGMVETAELGPLYERFEKALSAIEGKL
ncbi:DUF349 domain-containing protein [Lentisphaerota bacterium ZTH]|nr:DUF349 domain-containing protein [Lentisphaerota bacterium]WET05528.1 DUF349 domain-containing protein [Lentisphaerota bacterium ZTH]